MKLHLPVGLRAALLAILLCSPMAMGNVKAYQGVKEDGTGGTEVIPDEDGVIDSLEINEWDFPGDVVITVDGETTEGNGLTSLTYHGFTENCRTTITVESGGTFTCKNGSTIGNVTDLNSPPFESETIFNVSGGTVDLGDTGVGAVSEGASSAHSFVTFNISEKGQVLSSGGSIGKLEGGSSNYSEVTLKLTSGGKFKVRGLTISEVADENSSNVSNVSVEGEDSSVELDNSTIGNVSVSNSKSVVNIDVTQHGSFKLLNQTGGGIGTVFSADSHSDVYITVAGKGSLFEIASVLQKIGVVSTSEGGVQHLGSSTTKIEVKEGGVFNHKMGDVGLSCGPTKISSGGSAATTELMLTVDGGTYNMGVSDDKADSYLGGAGKDAGSQGKNTTKIEVLNGGQFNFQAKHGYIGASCHGGSDVTLQIYLDKKGVFSFGRYEGNNYETHIGYADGERSISRWMWGQTAGSMSLRRVTARRLRRA